jgi:hypothetical protein
MEQQYDVSEASIFTRLAAREDFAACSPRESLKSYTVKIWRWPALVLGPEIEKHRSKSTAK